MEASPANYVVGNRNDKKIVISTPFAAINIIIIIAVMSIRLIVQTRQIEINGPPPLSAHDKKRSLPPQDKVIFITGANSGIGLETTRLLYHQYNATVILACRSRARAIEAIQSIHPSWIDCSYSSSGDSFGNRMHFIPMDLTSMQSIHNAAKTFLEMKKPLHVLINNAGVMLNERMETVDGLEMTMAANVSIRQRQQRVYTSWIVCFLLFSLRSLEFDHCTDFSLYQHLGHFLLTNLLLPKLRETAMNDKHPTKVVTVSSSLYTNAVRRRNNSNNDDSESTRLNEPGIDLLDLQSRNKPYRLFEQYAQSKLANILFARELGRREKQLHAGFVQSYVLHPGLVRTNVTRNMPWYLFYPNLVFSMFMMMLQKSPQCGAYTTVYCAVTDEENDTSSYFVNSQKQPIDQLALSDEEARKLWKLSCQLVSLPLEKES